MKLFKVIICIALVLVSLSIAAPVSPEADVDAVKHTNTIEHTDSIEDFALFRNITAIETIDSSWPAPEQPHPVCKTATPCARDHAIAMVHEMYNRSKSMDDGKRGVLATRGQKLLYWHNGGVSQCYVKMRAIGSVVASTVSTWEDVTKGVVHLLRDCYDEAAIGGFGTAHANGNFEIEVTSTGL